MEDFQREIRAAMERILATKRAKAQIVNSIAVMDSQIAETTRYIAQKEQEMASVHVTRPWTDQLDRRLRGLRHEVERIQKSLDELELTKVACVTRMRELDDRIEADERIIQTLDV